MSVLWQKVGRDLTQNRVRTFLVVLSTSVGVFALGLVFGLSGVLHDQIVESHRASSPAHITFWGGPFNRELIDAVQRQPNVDAAEGETAAGFQWKLEGETVWRDGEVVSRAEYGRQGASLVHLLDGHWPDERDGDLTASRVLSIERLSSQFFDIPAGAPIVVKIGERERRIRIRGIVRAPVVLPPAWGGDALFFATPETAAWLSGSEDEEFERLYIRLESYSDERASETAERLQKRLERLGLPMGGYEISDPSEHWVQNIVDGVTSILLVMGVLSLGLSAFLIVNTMNAILAQQVWQIGVLKAIGATIPRVVNVYLAVAMIYGLLALLLAVPLGVVGVHLLARWLLDTLNIVMDSPQIVPAAVGIQAAVAVAVPLLAAAIPVLGGAGVTVQEAIQSHGLGGDFGQGPLDKLLGRVRGLPRPLMLSLRNTFRRKGRMLLTLLTLAFSGALFTMVLSTGASLDNTIAKRCSMGEDAAIRLDRPHRSWHLVKVAERVPGVIAAEVWDKVPATLLLSTGADDTPANGARPKGADHPVSVTGIPAGSQIFKPQIVRGRGLRPGDGHALVFTLRLAEEEGVRVGDQVTLSIADEESSWTIVGLYLSVNDVSDEFFVPLSALEAETGNRGRGWGLKVLTERNDADSQARVIQGLKDALAAQHIEVASSWSSSEQLIESQASFGLLTSIRLAMVILTAVVGSVGLMGTMSINVVERRREIGVMRAIGASSPSMVGMLVAEGVIVGMLSWMLAVPLSYPGARLFSDLIGQVILNMPLDFVYSVQGIYLWMLIVVALSALASLWPALQATSITIREALSYE